MSKKLFNNKKLEDYITVGELSKMLEKCNKNDVVILQKDTEGNGYSPLNKVEGIDDDVDVYVPETTWYGERRFSKLTPELQKLGYTEEDVYDDEDKTINAIFLVPVN